MLAEPHENVPLLAAKPPSDLRARDACPSFIGIGAQKCATTWIHANLAAHPELFMPVSKELDFFSYHYLRGFAWYRQQFAAVSGQVTGEISPSYLLAAEAPERVHAYDPQMRILVALRDPVERAFSSHVHEVRKGLYALADTSFEAGLAENPMYLDQSRYGRHLGRWFTSFDRHQILVVFQEEIAVDPERHLRAMYRFVGVNDDWLPPEFGERSHENIGYRNVALREALRFVGRTGRRLGLHELVTSAKRGPVLGSLYRMNRRDFRKEIGAMRDDTRLRLIEGLADDMRHLARLLGRDELPWPSWRAITAA